MSNVLLNSIKASQQAAAAAAAAGVDNVTIDPILEDVEWAPKEGEVMFEPSIEGTPIRTVFADGREVGFPYISSDKDEIGFLTAFAEHHGGLNVVKG